MTVCPFCKQKLVREIKEVSELGAGTLYPTYARNEQTITVVVYKCPNPLKCVGVGELSEEDYHNLGESQRRRSNP